MLLSDFDFTLPRDLIALHPLPKRDDSRLLVLDRTGAGPVEHLGFPGVLERLKPGDILLLNKTKVLPVRLAGRRPDGSILEILLVRELEPRLWEILSVGGYSGDLIISPRLSATVEGGRTAYLRYEGGLAGILARDGAMPLPPYIKRAPEEIDKERYQTVYANDEGSIAAPTAGLHFTPELLAAIADRGVRIRHLTLHVGRGTFAPIRAERLSEHRMEPERFDIPRALIEEILDLSGGSRLVAVGTTTTRAIEGYLSGAYEPLAYRSIEGGGTISGSTGIFIRPGYRFRAVSALITNFHLPRSTPLMLASALCGQEAIRRAYREAVERRYRFFSYGDAMLIA